MAKLTVPFSQPFFSEEDLDQILSDMRIALKSGWLTSGKNVEMFEDEFAKSAGTSYAVALNSCTAALHAILLALNIKQGDEVVVPTNTFVATANAVVYTGAKPVFADSDPNTFNLSVEDFEKKISNNTKAVIPVHLAGNPCDMKELCEIAHDSNIFLVEDCAHAHGAMSEGRSCGGFGIAGAFSFYPTKIVTMGEGGIVTTDNKKLAEKIKRVRNHGRGGYGPLEITDLGYNYRLSEIHAIIGISQMQHLSEFLAHRKWIADNYQSFFSKVEWIKPQLVKNGDICSYYAYLVKLTSHAPISRDELVRRLNEVGVGTSVLYHPVHTQPLYLKMKGAGSDLPVAVDLGAHSLALPLYNGMRKDELDFVKECLRGVIEPLQEQLLA